MNRPNSGRPRSQTNKSTISHKSNKSESTSEKTARGLTTKADPNSAVNEAQPSAIALESSTLGSLSEQVARDGENGTPASERDVSNPTRYRWERPLDTIRSFEAAIDRRFKHNAAVSDGASVFDGMSSPRSSFYGGGLNQPMNTRQHRASTYGGDDFGSTSNIGFYGNQRGPRYSQYRGQSDSNVYGYRNSGYMSNGGMNSRQPSQHYVPNDTSSGESHQWTQHTDPSSMNSSVDRLSPSGPPPPPAKHEQPRRETYGMNGFGQDPSLEYGNYGASNYSNGGGPPPPPPHNANGNGANGQMQPAPTAAPRAPIKFTSSGPPPTRDEVFPQKEKRRSLFSLRKK